MTAAIIPFPSRAQPRDARVHARGEAECVKRFDVTDGTWVVDAISASGDSEAFLGRYLDEAAADRRIACWKANHGSDDPKGAA